MRELQAYGSTTADHPSNRYVVGHLATDLCQCNRYHSV
jgi:hypothetical protein